MDFDLFTPGVKVGDREAAVRITLDEKGRVTSVIIRVLDCGQEVDTLTFTKYERSDMKWGFYLTPLEKSYWGPSGDEHW